MFRPERCDECISLWILPGSRSFSSVICVPAPDVVFEGLKSWALGEIRSFCSGFTEVRIV